MTKGEQTEADAAVERLEAKWLKPMPEGFDPFAQTREDLRLLLAERMDLREALAFYADPETYFAIAVLADRPCGEFADDFSEVWWEPARGMEEKPGKRAREVLGVDYSVSLYEAVEEARARSALQGNGGG